MSRCTAPSRGHRTASGKAACPACSGRGYSSGWSRSTGWSYASHPPRSTSTSTDGRSRGSRVKASWSPTGSTLVYTPEQVQSLTPVRRAVEARAHQAPELRDVFLCHAWDDRREAATDLCNLLEDRGVSVWFSEKDILLGKPFLREIDRGLAQSRTGLVLVTPSFLKRVNNQGVSDKELSALLARDLLFPVVHGITYDELREVSPLLGSRNGLDTAEDSMETVADKVAELVTVDDAAPVS